MLPRPSAEAVSCVAAVALLLALTARLTDHFEAWTYEDLRRRGAEAGALQAPAMQVRDAEGRARTVFDTTDVAATVTVLNFIYTRCASVCQVQGSEYAQMQQVLRTSGSTRIRLLSVSIDPGHDDQAALAAHARLHRADPALWAVTAPLDKRDGRAALRRLGVVAVPDGLGGYVHNGSLHLVDAAGRVRRIFDDAQWPQALAAARALAGEAP
jgi:protein SCO1/2